MSGANQVPDWLLPANWLPENELKQSHRPDVLELRKLLKPLTEREVPKFNEHTSPTQPSETTPATQSSAVQFESNVSTKKQTMAEQRGRINEPEHLTVVDTSFFVAEEELDGEDALLTHSRMETHLKIKECHHPPELIEQFLTISKNRLRMQIKHLGSCNMDTSATLMKLGELYITLNCYKEAEEVVKTALNIRLKLRGKFSAPVAYAYSVLGQLHEKASEKKEVTFAEVRYHCMDAARSYRECVQICEHIFGTESPEAAWLYYHFGRVERRAGKWEDATAWWIKSIEILLDNPVHANVDLEPHEYTMMMRDTATWLLGRQCVEQAKTILAACLQSERAHLLMSMKTTHFLGVACGLAAEDSEAESLLQDALAEANKLARIPYAACILFNLGVLSASGGHLLQASGYISQAKQAVIETGMNEHPIKTLAHKAEHEIQAGTEGTKLKLTWYIACDELDKLTVTRPQAPIQSTRTCGGDSVLENPVGSSGRAGKPTAANANALSRPEHAADEMPHSPQPASNKQEQLATPSVEQPADCVLT